MLPTNKKLAGHLISLLYTKSIFECLSQCLSDQNCTSVETSLDETSGKDPINCLLRDSNQEIDEIDYFKENFILRGN